jgi:hypothetical protein
MNIRTRIGWHLRCLADRIDPDHAPRRVGNWAFTYEQGRGLVFRDDRRGCPLWYLGHADHRRAHTEADTEWTTA